MPDQAQAGRRGFRARRGVAGTQRAYRLANSIRLPWAVGIAVLLLLAVGIATIGGRAGGGPLIVPQALLDAQRETTVAAGQSARRSLNEGVDDLDGLARILAGLDAASGRPIRSPGGGTPHRQLRPPGAMPPDVISTLRAFTAVHGRYLSVTLVDAAGLPVAVAGRGRGVGVGSAAPTDKAIVLAARPGPQNTPVIHQVVPVPGGASRVRWVVGSYNPEFLRFPLQTAEPGSAWLVDARGRMLGFVGGSPHLTVLPRPVLRTAAGLAARGQTGTRPVGGSLDRQEIVGFAPVSGPGPAGRLGWSVVTTRSVTSFALPKTDARRRALLAAISLAVVATVIFGWLYIIVLRPITRLQSEAERLAYGDLSQGVEIIRYDEIGLIARALERIRLALIRRRVRGD